MIDLFLDVDGVIIPVLDPDDPPPTGWDDWQPPPHHVVGAPVYSPAMVAALCRIAAHPDVRVHWCTVWRGRAADVLAPVIGLPEWPPLDVDMRWDRHETAHRTVRSWWKRDAIQEHHAIHGRDVVWVDDDLAFDEDARAWVESIGGMWLSPRTVWGLTPRHVERIAARVAASPIRG